MVSPAPVVVTMFAVQLLSLTNVVCAGGGIPPGACDCQAIILTSAESAVEMELPVAAPKRVATEMDSVIDAGVSRPGSDAQNEARIAVPEQHFLHEDEIGFDERLFLLSPNRGSEPSFIYLRKWLLASR